MAGVDVDFSLLGKAPDPIGDYQNAFQVGRAMAAQSATSNAFRAYAANPTAPIDPNLAAANPADYLALQNTQQTQGDRTAKVNAATALANGDAQGAATALGQTGDVAGVSAIQTAQRAAQADIADKFGGLIHAVMLEPDLNQRLSLVQHIVQASPQAATFLQHAGVDPSNLTPDSVSNNSLTRLMQGLEGLKADLANDKPQIVSKDSSLLYAPGSLGSAGAASGASGATSPRRRGRRRSYGFSCASRTAHFRTCRSDDQPSRAVAERDAG